MPRLNRQNIDRKTNKPEFDLVESLNGDRVLNRATQTRRDDDVIKTPHRTLFDVDYAIKWFIENEIQPQIKSNQFGFCTVQYSGFLRQIHISSTVN